MENPWKLVFKGNLLAILRHNTKGYERAIRPPGVRLLLTNKDGSILLTKEFRDEEGKIDYRLPGGKVFNNLESYLAVRENKDYLNKAVLDAARIEAKQEAGIDEIENLSVISKSIAGASVEWDLYYLTGNILKMGEQELEDDEKSRGIEVGLYSKEKVLEMLKSGQILEDRSANVLFKYMLNSK